MEKECNRFAGHSQCGRKGLNNSCPTGGTLCVSPYKAIGFDPMKFFAEKKAERERLLRESEVVC
jgi:hypothetical protein